MIKIIKVTGNSLSPSLLPGDYVLILKHFPFTKLYDPGDILVLNHSEYGLLIKKTISADPIQGVYEVGGTHPLSKDSNSLGLINHQDVIGKVIYQIKKPRI